MLFELGDIVEFQPGSLPDLNYHVDGNLVPWREHFNQTQALIDVTDYVNNQYRLRGIDRTGKPFIVWVDGSHIKLVRRGLETNG